MVVQLLREAKRKHLATGKDPSGLAAEALCVACQLRNEKVSQGLLAQAAKVTEVTVRKQKRKLIEGLNLRVA